MVKTPPHIDVALRDSFQTHGLLIAAAERGDLEEVRRILASSPELARQDSAGNDEHQALHYAIYGNQLEVVKVLLKAGADPLKGIYPHREATSPRAMAFDRGQIAIVHAIDRPCLRRARISARSASVATASTDPSSAMETP